LRMHIDFVKRFRVHRLPSPTLIANRRMSKGI
jgi:hypothetical protein